MPATRGMKKFVLKRTAMVAGFILAIVTILPVPWRVRCAWARTLALSRSIIFRIYKPTSFHGFLEAQNIEFNLGKQEFGAYESFKRFESILEFADNRDISFNQLKSLLEFTEKQNISLNQLKSFLEFADSQSISFSQLKSFLEVAEQT
jgi:hypothetical protein